MEADVDIEAGYPVTSNDGDFAEFSLHTATELLGTDRVLRLPHPVMGAEDFSYVLQRTPGAMVFLGATPDNRDPGKAAPNDSNRVVFDESAMTDGIAMYVAIALRHLKP